MAYSTATIAQGCFGKVYKEKYNDTWAAVKKVPMQLISRKDLERECDVYDKAKHPNIVKLLGKINLRDGKWIIPLEFIFGEDLETTIFHASKSKIQFSSSAKGTIIIGMCEGLLHLHSRDIVHQDLKPENIMVEHNTNRAVIIDLGLAKFFRYGLNSAADMGNEAYSAPEVLQRRSQRDQRSDVWAMGKIIAEFCARIRLYTPSVCPAKIKETLNDQPYCHAVCRMVETDPSLRASMGGVISDIRKAGGAGNTTTQKDLLKPPPPNSNVRNPSPLHRDPSPLNRTPVQLNKDPSPLHRDPSPLNRTPVQLNKDPSPLNRTPVQLNKDPSPLNRAPVQLNKDPSPLNRAPVQLNKDPSPLNRAPVHLNKDPSPLNRTPVQLNKDPSPLNRTPVQLNKDPSPLHRDPSPLNRTPVQLNKDPSPLNRGVSPLNWERSPRPNLKPFNPTPAQHHSLAPVLPKADEKALVLKGGPEVTHDFMKMALYQEAAKDLPYNLPATGRVMVRRFEHKDGELEEWQQKEVVTRDGKIVKFDDIRFNSK